MKQKILYLMCGCPGSGKSHWAKEVKDAVIVSRDEIRFNLLKDGEDYFAHEEEVVDTFIQDLNAAIATNDVIIADATHMSEKSRNATLNKLALDDVAIIPVSFELPLNKVLKQNDFRTGRAFVPKSVVRRMHAQYIPPSNTEKYKYEKIITIKENDEK